MRREGLVKKIGEIVRMAAPTAQAILFGSEARGESRDDSDIDVLILLNQDNPSLDDENVVRWPLYELEMQTGVSINPIIISRTSWENHPIKTPFYINIMREGIAI